MIDIYGLCDPRTGELRYIGKSSQLGERLARHIRKAKAGCQRHLRRWIAGILQGGHYPEVVILEVAESNAAANDAEIFWIASMRLAGFHLTNLTVGGDGQSKGFRHTAAARLKQSIAEKGKPWSAQHRANHAAALANPEVRAKMSAARKGIPLAPWIIEKAAKAKLGKKRSRESMEPAWAANRAKAKRRRDAAG